MTNVQSGGCICGKVRYQTIGDPVMVIVCHCTWCQKRTGSAFAVEPIFSSDCFEQLGADPAVYRHISDESGRWLDVEFCPTCGTNTGFTVEVAPGTQVIEAGTFDAPSWIDRNVFDFKDIFVRSAQHWALLPEGAQTYEKHFL